MCLSGPLAALWESYMPIGLLLLWVSKSIRHACTCSVSRSPPLSPATRTCIPRNEGVCNFQLLASTAPILLGQGLQLSDQGFGRDGFSKTEQEQQWLFLFLARFFWLWKYQRLQGKFVFWLGTKHRSVLGRRKWWERKKVISEKLNHFHCFFSFFFILQNKAEQTFSSLWDSSQLGNWDLFIAYRVFDCCGSLWEFQVGHHIGQETCKNTEKS